MPRRHGSYGGWGQWRDKFTCSEIYDSYVIGIQLRIEGKQEKGDDTAANDVKLICSGGRIAAGVGGGIWGQWTDPIVCRTVNLLFLMNLCIMRI